MNHDAQTLVAKRIFTGMAREEPITDGAVVIERGHIAWIGARRDLPESRRSTPVVDFEDRLITPGLVDAHTHAAWIGSRHDEYAIRMAGGDYRAIAAAGGGILASQRAVSASTEEALAKTLEERLQRMARLGVTCVEVKSGYGLLPELEKKLLRAIAKMTIRDDLPRVVPTFLALHAIPEEHRHARDAYVRGQAALIAEVAREKLARFVDAYVDVNAFTVSEARLVGGQARSLGLGVRLHVGQFGDVGGAELCADLGARSADHLEHISDAGILRLKAAKVSAVLLPVASFTLGQSRPPVQKLRDAEVPLIVASDANPGTAPTESLPLAMALAVRLYGLSPREALEGATRLAATSLDEPVGLLRQGSVADLVVWDLPHEAALVQPWGTSRAHLVMREGRPIAGKVHERDAR